jgi:hypothetical protein
LQHIETLHFGCSFNQKINVGTLSHNLLHLNFGNKFNQILGKGELPQNLSLLKFGDAYNQKFEPDVLPHGLKKIIFCISFDQPLLHLPVTVFKIEIKKNYRFGSTLNDFVPVKYQNYFRYAFDILMYWIGRIYK